VSPTADLFEARVRTKVLAGVSNNRWQTRTSACPLFRTASQSLALLGLILVSTIYYHSWFIYDFKSQKAYVHKSLSFSSYVRACDLRLRLPGWASIDLADTAVPL